MIAASILNSNGVKEVTDLRGAFIADKETDFNITDYVFTTKLLYFILDNSKMGLRLTFFFFILLYIP